jgi:hypothetical protein
MNKELEKIAKNFVSSKNQKNARGCYVTPDGSVFYRTYEGLQYARANVKLITDVCEFDESGTFVTPKNADQERAELIAIIKDSPAHKYTDGQLSNMGNDGLRKLASDLSKEVPPAGPSDDDQDDDGSINLDTMDKAQLIALLGDLDPTSKVSKETKAQLKDLIVNANTLTGYDDAKLIDIAKALNPTMIAEDMDNDEITKVFTTEELGSIVLNLRDNVELDSEITDKLFALGADEN